LRVTPGGGEYPPRREDSVQEGGINKKPYKKVGSYSFLIVCSILIIKLGE